jgi:hypothetical protein
MGLPMGGPSKSAHFETLSQLPQNNELGRVNGARINEHEKRQEKRRVEESARRDPVLKKEPIATAIPSMTFNTLNARSF